MTDMSNRRSSRGHLSGILILVVLGSILVACQDSSSISEEEHRGSSEGSASEQTWSQILISFQGAMNSRSDRPREEARELAQELLGRLRGGGSFDRLARTYSDHPSAMNGGRIGLREENAPQIDRMVTHLDSGEVGPAVIETAEGFHLVRRD